MTGPKMNCRVIDVPGMAKTLFAVCLLLSVGVPADGQFGGLKERLKKAAEQAKAAAQQSKEATRPPVNAPAAGSAPADSGQVISGVGDDGALKQMTTESFLADYVKIEKSFLAQLGNPRAQVVISADPRGGVMNSFAGLAVSFKDSDGSFGSVLSHFEAATVSPGSEMLTGLLQSKWTISEYMKYRNGALPGMSSLFFWACDEVPAFEGRMERRPAPYEIERDVKRCNEAAYSALAPLKGDLAEAISKRPRDFLDGTDSDEAERDRLRLNGGFQGMTEFIQAKSKEIYAKKHGSVEPGFTELQNRSAAGDKAARKEMEALGRQAAEENVAQIQAMLAPVTEQMLQGQRRGLERLSEAHPEVADRSRVRFLESLGDGELFVDVYRYKPRVKGVFAEDHYAAMVSSKEEFGRRVDLGLAAAWDQAVNAFVDATRRPDAPLGTALEALRKAVWEPIRELAPAGTKLMYVSPDGALGMAPWMTLANSDQRKDVPLVSVLQAAYQLTRAAKPSKAPNTVLLVGDFDYGPEGANGRFYKLEGAAKELAALEEIARRKQRTVRKLVGAAGTATAITGAMPAARYVHVASHGEVEDRGTGEFSLTNAGIALSGANTQAPGSMLTAGDLAGLDLRNTELIVMSACETGSGRVTEGQGLLGFQTALMAAGTHALLAPLWRVPDEPTKMLMDEFYGAWWAGGKTKAEALRLAQRSVRAKFPDVRDWGAWQLVGEGR